jgi:hypothetical protein
MEWFANYLHEQGRIFFHRDRIEPEHVAAYWRLLRKYTDDEIRKAFATCLSTKKHPGLPMPAEVIEAVRVTKPPAPVEEEPPMTPEEALRMRAMAAFCAWSFREKRYGDLETLERRRAALADFEADCAKDPKRAHLIGAINVEGE